VTGDALGVHAAHHVTDRAAFTRAVPDSQIEVQVKDGCITLSGEVEWEFQRVAAEHAVCNLVGVRGRHERDPSRIARYVEGCPGDDREGAGPQRARRRWPGQGQGARGRVVLQGKVRTWLEHDEAIRAARRMPGVRAVHDNLAVVP
jgi:osmotically-inducible protein OsmY